MMTYKEILEFISNSKDHGYNDLLNATPAKDLNDTSIRLKYLIKSRYVSGEARSYSSLHLTEKGRFFLDTLIEQEEQEARNRRILEEQMEASRKQNVKTNRLSILALVLTGLSLLLTHWDKIKAFFLGLFSLLQ